MELMQVPLDRMEYVHYLALLDWRLNQQVTEQECRHIARNMLLSEWVGLTSTRCCMIQLTITEQAGRQARQACRLGHPRGQRP